MVEGQSGILEICPPWNRPTYEPSKRRLTWPNGARAITYSADEPARLRGPQHDAAWCDELATWRYPEAWDQLQFGLRLPPDPRAIITTTPRPIPLIRELLSDTANTVTSRMTSYENRDNLAPAFFAAIVKKYEGTRLGRQELLGELLGDVPGALWTRDLVDRARIELGLVPTLTRVVVAIDPSVSNNQSSDECGLIVAGRDAVGQGYLLQDASGLLSPGQWAKRAVDLYHYWRADRVVAEVNNGGDLVENALRAVPGGSSIAYRAVHASRGKETRAEPAAALYEQNRVFHVRIPDTVPIPYRERVGDDWDLLEDQMTQWVPGKGMKSPDRMDAAVWALTDLILNPAALSSVVVVDWSTQQISPV